MNKQGVVKTLEAIVAVVILFGFILFLTPAPQEEQGIPEPIKQTEQLLLQAITSDDNIRSCAATSAPGVCQVGTCADAVNQLIEQHKPHGYLYACELCDKATSCLLPGTLPDDQSIYTSSIFLGGTQEATIVRYYLWEP